MALSSFQPDLQAGEEPVLWSSSAFRREEPVSTWTRFLLCALRDAETFTQPNHDNDTLNNHFLLLYFIHATPDSINSGLPW